MSTMRTDLLQNRLGTSHPAVTKADFVKAWMNVNQQGTMTLYSSLGVSSITDGGIGLTGQSFTNPFVNNTYVSSTDSQGISTFVDRSIDTLSHLVGSQTVRNIENNAGADSARLEVINCGVLA